VRNIHIWKTTNEEGTKREVRAEKFGGQWRIQAQLKGETTWTYYDTPLLEDLVELRDVLWRKYQRKRIAFDDVAAIDELIRQRQPGP
jgi:hypothetical protein